MNRNMFTSMSDVKMASLIRRAKLRVAVAAPGLRLEAAEALAEAIRRLGADNVAIVTDCDEEVFRLGYGDLDAIEALREAGGLIRQCSGLRLGVLVCDELAWVYGPTALYVQQEVHSDETPNAVELRAADVERLLLRLSPAAREQALAGQTTEEAREEAERCEIEMGLSVVSESAIRNTHQSLELAPPVPFDVARQVRVFEPYIQYVDISLLGCAIQRHRVEIPKSIQGIGAAEDIESRLRTTFDLIEKSSKVSSKLLEDELAEIRKNFTRAMGKPWGRVLLRSVRPRFDERIAAFRQRLDEHKKQVRKQLTQDLDDSRKRVVDHYLPFVRQNLPDALTGQLITQNPTDDDISEWLDLELRRVFPEPDALLTDMRLEVTFRDVTYETLNEKGFAEALRSFFPHVDWDKPFDEFNAAKEREGAE